MNVYTAIDAALVAAHQAITEAAVMWLAAAIAEAPASAASLTEQAAAALIDCAIKARVEIGDDDLSAFRGVAGEIRFTFESMDGERWAIDPVFIAA